MAIIVVNNMRSGMARNVSAPLMSTGRARHAVRTTRSGWDQKPPGIASTWPSTSQALVDIIMMKQRSFDPGALLWTCAMRVPDYAPSQC
jgi:hypothetical protein